MGDRGNIFLKHENIWFYSHWSGSDLGVTIRDALIRARGGKSGGFNDSRWEDSSYLNRIIFCEMIKDHVLDTTGFGISNDIGDNSHPVICVDTTEQTVSILGVGHVRPSGAKTSPERDKKSFADVVKLTDKEARVWHLGKDDDNDE